MQFILAPILLPIMSTNALTIITSALLLVIALILYGSFLKEEFQRFKINLQTWGKFILKSFGFYVLLYFLRVLVLVLLMNFMDVGNLLQSQRTLNYLSTTLSFLPMFFIVSIYAPIVEELVFREGFIAWVNKDNRSLLITMTVLSVIVFTAPHSFTLADFLLYLPLAMVLTRYYFDYDRNMVGSIFYHFVNNTIAVITMFVLL